MELEKQSDRQQLCYPKTFAAKKNLDFILQQIFLQNLFFLDNIWTFAWSVFSSKFLRNKPF